MQRRAAGDAKVERRRFVVLLTQTRAIFQHEPRVFVAFAQARPKFALRIVVTASSETAVWPTRVRDALCAVVVLLEVLFKRLHVRNGSSEEGKGLTFTYVKQGRRTPETLNEKIISATHAFCLHGVDKRDGFKQVRCNTGVPEPALSARADAQAAYKEHDAPPPQHGRAVTAWTCDE